MGRAVQVVALQHPAVVGAGHDPALAVGEAAVVVGQVDAACAVVELAAQDVAFRRGVVRIAVLRVPGHRGPSDRIYPVALDALAVGVGHAPAGLLQTPVVVGKVNVARARIDVHPAHHEPLGAGVGPPARIGSVYQAAPDEPAVRGKPIALHAVVQAAPVDQPAGMGGSAIVVVHVAGGVFHPAALGRRRRLGG